MRLPEQGLGRNEIVAELAAKRSRDARWQDGRTFTAVYDGGPSVHEVAETGAVMFLHAKALKTGGFPSPGEIPAGGRSKCAGLVHAPADPAGFLTSGGTQSIPLTLN